MAGLLRFLVLPACLSHGRIPHLTKALFSETGPGDVPSLLACLTILRILPQAIFRGALQMVEQG